MSFVLSVASPAAVEFHSFCFMLFYFSFGFPQEKEKTGSVGLCYYCMY